MIKGEADVSSERKVLGVAKFPVFETVKEAIDHPEEGLGEEKLLDLLNSQIKTNAMNLLRTNKTKGPTKGALRSEAWNEICQEIANREHPDCLGNKKALDELVEKRILIIEARMNKATADAEEEEDEED